jgi:hypothetical protein
LRRPNFRLWSSRDSSALADIEGQSRHSNSRRVAWAVTAPVVRIAVSVAVIRRSQCGTRQSASRKADTRSDSSATPATVPPTMPAAMAAVPSVAAECGSWCRKGDRRHCQSRRRSRSCPFEGIDHDRSPYSCGGAACRSQPIRQSVCSFASITSQSQQLETARSFRGSTLATAATLMRRPVTRLSNRRSTPHSDWRSGMSKRMPTAVIERIALGDAAMPFRSS